MLPAIDDIVADFEFLDEWEERYRYLIELGRMLPPFPEEARTDANKVQGCASQVWLRTGFEPAGAEPRLDIVGDSDAHIVRGLVALLISFYRGKSPEEVAAHDPIGLFKELGLSEHLTPQRSNGVRSMVERIRSDARSAAALS
jgi:cysteine desulfuration protein SufE